MPCVLPRSHTRVTRCLRFPPPVTVYRRSGLVLPLPVPRHSYGCITCLLPLYCPGWLLLTPTFADVLPYDHLRLLRFGYLRWRLRLMTVYATHYVLPRLRSLRSSSRILCPDYPHTSVTCRLYGLDHTVGCRFDARCVDSAGLITVPFTDMVSRYTVGSYCHCWLLPPDSLLHSCNVAVPGF